MSERSVQLPTKDCPTCQRRRIKCDRGLPGCAKCAKRKFDCPGYGLQLKWGQGVASRGRLQGQAIPVHETNASNSMLVSSNGRNLSSDLQLGLGSGVNFLRIQPTSPATLLGSPSVDLSLSGPRPPHASRLLAWFKERVAQRLAWIDGPQNPWRQIILPLAENSETVLSSVLALAAHDLASQYPQHDLWFVKFQDISNAYQNKALSLLAKELGTLTASSSSSSSSIVQSTPDASMTLASVIILCNNELLKAQSSGWKIHLQAARELILVNSNAKSSYLQQQLLRIQEFLLQEFYATSVWTQLTTFDDMNVINNINTAPTSTEDAAVADFIRIIYQTSQLERSSRRSETPLPLSQIEDILTQIESARIKSFRLSEKVDFWTASDRNDFELVVWMFYHANLVYCAQAFPVLRESGRVDVFASRDRILNHVKDLSETRNGMWAQDLVWPLFIAGTELRGDKAGQRFVENAFRDVMRLSRTLDRARVLSFLGIWWGLEMGGEDERSGSWIQLARERPQDFNFMLL
ncbi:hypothetical protein N7478_001265 [Penicillium angulare]|uniref:uncharacterized protein n=1 Tax=Penicillium angulare TaxID=116970 RepID=UPI002540CA27|nr:uncharacterized protein N7478_001265 [Penicillium angulare]KAJ5292014.1 hypothetical protein N7478_001265 [Penicillium angulare]